MAKCPSCEQEMSKHKACTLEQYDDRDNPRVPYDRGEPGNCHDCGVPNGGLHHPGCDMERCADCGGQQISCDCNYKPPSIKKGLILRVLELNDGLCMDNKKEREKLADELLKAINSDLLLQTERNES